MCALDVYSSIPEHMKTELWRAFKYCIQLIISATHRLLWDFEEQCNIVVLRAGSNFTIGLVMEWGVDCHDMHVSTGMSSATSCQLKACDMKALLKAGNVMHAHAYAKYHLLSWSIHTVFACSCASMGISHSNGPSDDLVRIAGWRHDIWSEQCFTHQSMAHLKG